MLLSRWEMGTSEDSFGSDLAEFARTPTAVAPATFTGTERYELVRPLGEGSFGVVYEAHDHKRNRRLALKLLRKIEPTWLYRFKREFRSLAAVRHENLVSLGELVATEDTCFFTMDLVRGRPLSATSGDTHEVFRQLASGLAALHAEGILHRDIKPSNVLYDESGRVVLVDFGLAVEADNHLSTVLAGTPHFMAPELFVGGAPSEASDWFAVGVMLYEALTGVLINARELASVKPALELAPAADPVLAALAMDLIDADPAARPVGHDVLERLGAQRARTRETHELFVGRADDLALLRATWRRATPGHPQVVFVAGDSGVGKSALLRHFLEGARQEPDALVLAHRCFQQETVPFKALDGVVDQLSRALSRMPVVDAEAVTPRHAGALVRLFPVLRQVRCLDRTPPSESDDMAELRWRGIEALRELVARLCDRRRVLIAVDDLQWGDADSARLLARLLRAPDAPGVLFVGAHRLRDRRHSPFFEELRAGAELLTGVNITEHELGALSRAQAGTLYSKVAGAAPQEEILDDAAGNPFFLLELARSGIEGRATLEELLNARVAALPPPAQRLLSLLAVAEEPLPEKVARRALDDELDASVRALQQARLGGRCEVDDRACLEGEHGRVLALVRDALAPAKRRELHRALADGFSAVMPDASEQIGRHLLGAGERDPALEHLRRAADRAFESGANVLAARLYEQCLNLCDDRGTPEALTLARRLGETHVLRGFGKRASDTYLSAARHASGDEAFELRVRAMRLLLTNGYLDEGMRMLHATLDEVGIRAPRTLPGVMLAAGKALVRIKTNGYNYTLRDRQQIAPDDLKRLAVLHAGSNGLFGIQPVMFLFLLSEQVRLALAVGDAEYLASALTFSVGLVAVAGATREARRALEALRELVVRASLDRGDERILMAEAWMSVARGDWMSGAQALADAWEAGHTEGPWGMRNRHSLFNAYYWTGELGLTRRDMPAHMELVREQGDRLGYFWIRMIQSWVLCGEDRPRDAIEVIDRATASWPGNDTTIQDFWANNNRGFVALYRTDHREARLHFGWKKVGHLLNLVTSENRDAKTQVGSTMATLAMLELRDASRFRRRKLIKESEHAIKTMESAGLPWGIAWARAQRGALAWLRGDRVAAIDHLAASAPLLEGAGMKQVLAASRRAHARLVGGRAGERIEALVDAYVEENGIVNPERFFGMYLITPRY